MRLNRQHNKNKSYKFISLIGIIYIILLSTVQSGCASTQRRDKVVVQVLEAQSNLLKKIKSQRESAEIKEKLALDPELKGAEAALLAAVDALIESNKKLKATLITSAKEEHDNE